MLRSASGEPTVAQPRSSYRSDIQGLRAVAVLLIVLAAMGISQLSGGYVGLDVFFVLSGFLITGLLVSGSNSEEGITLAELYAGRARRILPAATLVLLVTLVASYVLLGAERAAEVARETIWAAVYGLNWTYSLGGTQDLSPVQHYWSLSVLGQFYLLWPALVLAVLFAGSRASRYYRRRRPSRTRRIVLGVVIGAVSAAALIYSVLATAADPGAAYFSSLTRLWEFGLGAILAIAAPRLAHLPDAVKAAIGWVGLAGIVASAVLLTDATAYPGAVALLPVLATVFVIAGGIEAPRYGAGALLGLAPLRWLGDRSYPLYLWHWPVLVLAAGYLEYQPSIGAAVLLMAGALLLAMATYTFVEHPIHRGVSDFFDRRVSLLLWPSSLAALVTAVVVALSLVQAPEPTPAATGPVEPTATESAPAEPEGDTEVDGQNGAGDEDTPEAAVRAAVAAAAAGALMPPVVSPPLVSLRSDTWEGDAPCRGEFEDVTTEICGYGPEDAAESMVIIGDARAGMWLPALATVAESSGRRVTYLVKAGCTTADVVAFSTDGGQARQSDCAEWRTWALEQTAELAPDIAILSERGTKSLLAEDGSEIVQATPEHAAAWEAGMLTTISTLRESVPRVVVLSATPESEVDPLGCLNRGRVTQADCLYELGQNVAGINGANQRAAAAAGGELLDLTPWFCHERQCPLVVDRTVVLSDSRLISRTYARYLAESLRAALGLD
ncbi:SGNH hydrolase domain-containing protein [soil metagenome]